MGLAAGEAIGELNGDAAEKSVGELLELGAVVAVVLAVGEAIGEKLVGLAVIKALGDVVYIVISIHVERNRGIYTRL